MFACALLLACPAAGMAQIEDLEAECGDFAGESRSQCALVAQSIEVVQPRVGQAFLGGNPVPGTASTLGMRLGSLPRTSLAFRLTGVHAELPAIDASPSTDPLGVFVPAFNADLAVGVFSGFSPGPTIGGFGSFDLLASVGFAPYLGGEQQPKGTPLSWAVGGRLGLTRESFTLPGISASLMYRRVHDVAFGDPALVESDGFFDGDLSILSARAGITKQVLLFGATAGLGYDRFSSDVGFGFDDAVDPVLVDGFVTERFTGYANLSYTLFILHAVAEIGWQGGGDAVEQPLPDGIRVDAGAGTIYGSFSLRLSI